MKTFRIDGAEYTLKTYSDNDVCKYIYETLGITSDKMTVAEYTVLGVFTNIDDVVRLLRLEEYIPVKPAISPASIDKVVDRVEQEKKDYNYMISGGEIKNPVRLDSFVAYGIDLGSVVTYHIDYSKLVAPDKFEYHK